MAVFVLIDLQNGNSVNFYLSGTYIYFYESRLLCYERKGFNLQLSYRRQCGHLCMCVVCVAYLGYFMVPLKPIILPIPITLALA